MVCTRQDSIDTIQQFFEAVLLRGEFLRMGMQFWQRISRPAICFATAALLFGLPACGLSLPRLRSPGTIEQQRFRATLFDPYPNVDIAPHVEGGRPREFQRPLPEAERSRLVQQWLTPIAPPQQP